VSNGEKEREAWRRHALVRERATFSTGSLVICVLVPAWSVFDFLFEPHVAWPFLGLRLAVVALTLLLWRYIKRSADLQKNRLAMSAALLAVGGAILAMLPHVRQHHALYTFGFSLVFWGSGLILVWPVSFAARIYGALLASHVVIHVAFGENVSRADFLFSVLYLISAAVISSGQLVVRRRLEDDAFRAALAIEERNADLASTVAALSEAQARLVVASAALAESLDVETSGERVMSVAVPAFGSWALLVARGPGGTTTRAAAHVDQGRVAGLLGAVAEGLPLDAGKSQTECIAEATPDHLTAIGGRALRDAVDARSLIVAPLVARGSRTGTLVLGRMDRDFGPTEVAIAEELARRAAMALENARLFKETEDAVRLRDEFLAVAAHELRTPLTPLRLTLDALRESQGRAAPTERHLARLDRQVARFTRLVDQLLDVSQLAAGQLVLEREDVELSALVREVSDRFEDEATTARSPIEVTLGGPVRGSWDRARLEEAISSLLSNAIKYGAGKPVHVELSRADGRAALRVSDQGIGIDASDQARIFGRFERAVPVWNFGGFGQGLWIVRRIAEAHGGSIRVESEPGAGAVFVLELPVHHEGEGS
jgi:signal transduction histidine kinase